MSEENKQAVTEQVKAEEVKQEPVEAKPETAPVPEVKEEEQPAPQKEVEYRIPPQNEPLSPWAYIGLQILFAIPIVGFIFLIVFSFNKSNINRRNFALSYFAWWLLCVIAVVVVIVVLGGTILSMINGG